MFILVTNKKLCKDDFFKRVEKIAEKKPFAVILREKDMDYMEYKFLAEKCFEICNKNKVNFIINSRIDIAVELSINNIHLPLNTFIENIKNLESFKIKGVSVHSKEEGIIAEKYGADYIIAGHIFSTDCKKGIQPRGLNFLKDICTAVDIPVFGIGGMEKAERYDIAKAKAAGSCFMSSLMTCSDIDGFLKHH